MTEKYKTTLGRGEDIYLIPKDRKKITIEDVVKIHVQSEIATDIEISYPEGIQVISNRDLEEMNVEEYLDKLNEKEKFSESELERINYNNYILSSL